MSKTQKPQEVAQNPHEENARIDDETGVMKSQLESRRMRNTQVLGLETYLRITQLINERFVPFSKPTLWRRVQDGSFPKPIRIQGVTAWRLSDIQAWQRSQLETANAQ